MILTSRVYENVQYLVLDSPAVIKFHTIIVFPHVGNLLTVKQKLYVCQLIDGWLITQIHGVESLSKQIWILAMNSM